MKKISMFLFCYLMIILLTAKVVGNFPIVELTQAEELAYQEIVRNNPEENSFFPINTGNYWNFISRVTDPFICWRYSRRQRKIGEAMEVDGELFYEHLASDESLGDNPYSPENPVDSYTYNHEGWLRSSNNIVTRLDSLYLLDNYHIYDNQVLEQDLTIDLDYSGNNFYNCAVWCSIDDWFTMLLFSPATQEQVIDWMWQPEIIERGYCEVFGTLTEYKSIYYRSNAADDRNHVNTFARGVGCISAYDYEAGELWLEGCTINGVTLGVVSNDDSVAEVPEIKMRNYPNPFNPETTISFDLPEESDVRLEIYNIKGQKVKTLQSERLDAGNHSVIWNGTNSNSKQVASGVYFYRLTTGKKKLTKKMILMK